MIRKSGKKALGLIMAMMTVFTVSCGSASPADSAPEEDSGQGVEADDAVSFAEAHDAFTTTLTRKENDNDPIPEPPEGVFDLITYSSGVGDLAAYVSSDPGDGEKHPMIIWVVGGWGNGIDDFPWVYPEWDNDQTGSAFWQEGILTMYPSFRGGNGNPGYYEALFGEVDDIVSAYEYAASLSYVDPERIYLGGHSTGGTRALLASEYTDKFRAVFCFGAVDEVKYHNNDQFTFDTDNEDEYIMRSPIYWLDDIKSPTFLIEGRDGNSANLERIEQASGNDKIHCYVVDGADHFSVLAPATRLVAKKILEDTGAEPKISITQEELDEAMEQEAPYPEPVMTRRYLEDSGVRFSCPYQWEIMENADGSGYDVYSRYSEENAWDMSALYIHIYLSDSETYLQSLGKSLEEEGYMVDEISVNDHPAVDASTILQSEAGEFYYEHYVCVQDGTDYVDFDFITYGDYLEEADILFTDIIGSITLEK